MNRLHLLPILLFAITLSAAAQPRYAGESASRGSGDYAAAERYLVWAEEAIAGGRWPEALAALERAADFADVSSDLSFLLAKARSHEHKSRGLVLEALGRAFEADRWTHYSPAQARLLEAEQLIGLRNYSGALGVLPGVLPRVLPAGSGSADAEVLRLEALLGLSENTAGALGGGISSFTEFRLSMADTLNRYPRDPRPLRIFFQYARNKNPASVDQDLMETALRRLPFLLETDPDLSWMAAPFIRDIEEARRMVTACRAGATGPAYNGIFRPNPASIPAALNLGIISDTDAVNELFSIAPNGGLVLGTSTGRNGAEGGSPLDKDLIVSVSELLRSEEGRNLFTEKLLVFSGIITADDDGDGIPESRALYQNGVIKEYSYDANQDGLTDLFVSFNTGGLPQWAEDTLLPDTEFEQAGISGLPLRDEDRLKALIRWERYPSLFRAETGGTAYIPRPGSYQFAPIRFIELGGSGTYAGLLYPCLEQGYSRLTQRSLLSFSVTVERPSAEFKGALERIELYRGIPLRAAEILNGRIVSETEFENGMPVLQRIDLDLDGRMETVRRFRRAERAAGTSPDYNPLDYQKIIEFSQSDWNDGGKYQTAEEYRKDGSVVYSWDMDGDGIREYSEIKTETKNETEHN